MDSNEWPYDSFDCLLFVGISATIRTHQVFQCLPCTGNSKKSILLHVSKVSDGFEKVSDDLGNMSDHLGKVSDGPGKVSDGLGKVSDGPGNVSDSDR